MAPDEHISAFERIRQTTDDCNEFWSARELSIILDYPRWQKFRPVITKAMEACENSGYAASDHITRAGKMVALGSGSEREIEDFHLSRYACYLIVQNADPSKEIVAQGQTYFAMQTRRQELADEAALAGMDEDHKRLYTREQLRTHNKQLADAAHDAGVATHADFAIFQNHGYRGLYGGLGRQAIAARKGLKPSQEILDHMGSTELAANLFRATQTEEKLRREGIQGRENANEAHRQVGTEVRAAIKRLGGTMPENLTTPPESIAHLERKRQQAAQPRLPGAARAALFGDPDTAGEV
ncbi:MAG TPA: DNA damage-inducible protein D [Ktedonobacterales bacterium]|nr:DNA damage-inducible protein D [Ktedonobacterales bacterium]